MNFIFGEIWSMFAKLHKLNEDLRELTINSICIAINFMKM